MGHITAFTGKSSVPNIEILENTAVLIITKDGAPTNETISAKLRIDEKDIYHSSKITLNKLSEISASVEGFTIASNSFTQWVIPIGIDGGYQFSKDRKLKVELESLDNTKNYEVMAIAGVKVTNMMYQFEEDFIQLGSKSKNVSLVGTMNAYIEPLTALEKVSLNLDTHPSDLTKTELKALNYLGNDLICVNPADVTENTYGFQYLLKVDHAPMSSNMQITSTGATNIYYILEKGIIIN